MVKLEININGLILRLNLDPNTEVWKTNKLRDITDKELNEIMEEIERGPVVIKDKHPLANIRESALNT